METNPGDNPSLNTPVVDTEVPHTMTSMNTTETESSRPQAQFLSKTVSSPTALSLNVNLSSTPTLGSIGKQGSINFRHSLLYDSGAEGSDADDQVRLIRTPSVRSHKFIIIPATSPALGQQAKFPSATSTSSLTALQKLPLRSPTNSNLATPTTPTSSLTARTPHQLLSPLTKNPALSLSRSDVVYHHPHGGSGQVAEAYGGAASGSTSANPSVKFTIEDYESDNATTDAAVQTGMEMMGTSSATPTSAPMATTTSAVAASSSSTLDALYSFQMPAISSIYSGISSTQLLTGGTATTTQQPSSLSPAFSAQVPVPVAAARATRAYSPSPRPASAVFSSSSPPIGSAVSSPLGIGLRPRNDRNSSMRSVVSAYLSDPNELTVNSLLQQDDSSSYLFRDCVANQIYSDITSVRSLASIGIGSTDGRKIVIRRVPQTPTDLLNIVNPPTPQLPGVDDDDDESYMDMSDDSNNLKPRQQHWASKMQFVLACIGYSVGLGNVWRFPYMCYKSGGGVFLVPYCIILIICSIPLLFMELSIGQYTGRGPIGALGQLCPLFKGAGLASVVVSFLMSTYYSVIIGYSIYYFFTSFKTDMPWVDCSNRWNTPDCWVPQRVDDNMTSHATSRTPSEEFFENKVLQISPGIEYPGLMRWELFACLICAWLMVYFATWKSIKSSAKVRYFTATFPFFLIIVLMGRAVTLEGADDGLRYFFRPNWSELKNANVWINAASQNFNSLGITFGSMISFASYNKYNNNILRDTVAVSVVNILTSLLVGVFAFATLGNLALEQNTNVKDVIGDGPGLIFVVYPQAMAKMPYAQLWAVMFFFMLLCLGLNSQFAIVEVVVTSIQDGFPNWIKKHLGYHEIVVLIVSVISFLFGLPNLIQGGIYFFQLMDHYAASVTIMFLAFCQMIAIAWFYGTGRLSKNVKQMTGKAPSLYLKSCWILFGPCLLFAIWILSLINYKEPTYHNGRYTYPDWAYGIGWMFASFSLVCIPGYAIVNLFKAQGRDLQERFQSALRPNIYECKICGEHHCEHDYPEQEQYMLTQELAGIYKPAAPMQAQHTGFPLNSGQKAGYNPMHLQVQIEKPRDISPAKEENADGPSTSAPANGGAVDNQYR
ncbi:sodium- and chloride-dependent GABA transporter ine [Stomoxys calcitrans]|uniref:sodium- and chloride-dependent GABA transporter ine n=1 Tax=Stomoxys calcitrans TaxID=35570 RepID=UPI0027E30951|nr:sodium- and chloride-dependent GABA transporter ine [Stomoxys calcitrans]XP_013104534.2 sodium- and chloride-dependent GABA transporter ine [Stomoxys calcitrans]XP_013104536.2 sodium- and chloride-dependent GABA transporter ine [Stomoxys calcitrans]XP_013104538.2 sodium- and chloride-dependent GABA transporter ine [Stomoxys calcitrans]